MGEADDPYARGRRRAKIGRRLVVLALVFFLVALGMFAYYFTLPQYTGPRCWGFFDHPDATLSATPTANGYAFEVTSTSHVKPLDCYSLLVLKDDEPFWSTEPPTITRKEIVDGQVGTGPAGEYVNFTDSDGNGKLNVGDLFTLESLEGSTEYELYLLKDVGEMIASEQVTTP